MRDWLTKDFGWKIFSVVLAVVILLTVRNGGVESGAPGLLSVQKTCTNVVSAVFTGGGAQNVSIETNAVLVTVSGSPDTIAALSTDSIHAIVNLTGIDSAHRLKCHVEVTVPPRVTLLNVDPPDVMVTIPATK
jgi:YbbR domain-containing protein